MDPISNLTMDHGHGDQNDVKGMLMRLIDHLKVKNITGLFTSLVMAGEDIETSEVGVSSLMDTWVLLRNNESNGERTRQLVLLKSRGMTHSTEVREFILSDEGIRLVDVFVEDGHVLTGRARRTADQQQNGRAKPSKTFRGRATKPR